MVLVPYKIAIHFRASKLSISPDISLGPALMLDHLEVGGPGALERHCFCRPTLQRQVTNELSAPGHTLPCSDELSLQFWDQVPAASMLICLGGCFCRWHLLPGAAL